MAKDLKKLLKSKLDEAQRFFDVKLNPNDPSLENQLTLGDDWDNPNELSKALDMQPAYYVRWASVLRKLERQREIIQLKFNVWQAEKMEKCRNKLVKKRVAQGLTKRQAIQKITQAMIDNEFNVKYNYDNAIFVKYKKPLDDINEHIDNVKLVVDAFKQRKETLVALTYLVKSMIEHDLTIMKKGKKKKGKKE